MRLYNANLSPYAARVRVVLYAKGLDCEIVPPPGGPHSPEYAAINPIEKVPALEDGGTVIPESEVIAEYLEDAYPEPSLRPADLKDRARARVVSRIADLYVMTAMTKLFRQRNPDGRDADAVAAALGDLDAALKALDHFVVPARYAVGDRLTLADAALATALFFVDRLCPLFGRSAPFDGAGKVAAYYSAVRGDPVIARVLDEMAAAYEAMMKRA